MIDFEQTIISQYANSPTIMAICSNMNDYIDPRANLDDFFDFVWNVDTAEGFGLDIWGRIVNISRVIRIPSDVPFFGFSTGTTPFDEAAFYTGQESTEPYTLDDDDYRKLILVKAMANISSTNSPSLNQLLQNVFAGRGRCYVSDMGNMTMRYTFEFLLTPVDLGIIYYSGAMARPAGVRMLVFNADLPFFGFQEAGTSAAPFDEGVFYA